MMYVGTPNVDDTAVRIAQLGGRVLKQPEDIPNTGRFAVVQDPFGATFGIYTPNKPGPAREKPGLGDFSWFELYTPNPDGAWNFYRSLFGWEKTSAMDMGAMGVYQMFGRGGGIPNGGIMKPPPGAPAAWMPYALVQDAKAAAAAATANGAKIVNGPMEVPGGDWIAQGMDPQGAMFSVHSLNPSRHREGGGAREEGHAGEEGDQGRGRRRRRSGRWTRAEERREEGEGQEGEGQEGEGQTGEEGGKALEAGEEEGGQEESWQEEGRQEEGAKRKK